MNQSKVLLSISIVYLVAVASVFIYDRFTNKTPIYRPTIAENVAKDCKDCEDLPLKQQ